MALTDFERRIAFSTSIKPLLRTTTANGTGVDISGYGGVTVVFSAGTVTDGTHTPKLQDSADNSAWADVASTDQIGTLAAIATNVDQKVAYIGTKQYIRPVITVTASPGTGATLAAVVIRHASRKQP